MIILRIQTLERHGYQAVSILCLRCTASVPPYVIPAIYEVLLAYYVYLSRAIVNGHLEALRHFLYSVRRRGRSGLLWRFLAAYDLQSFDKLPLVLGPRLTVSPLTLFTTSSIC